jgi:2-dehydropantoate 2-reductase
VVVSQPFGKILVWGCGAIGGCIGAALIRAGHDVLLVDRAAGHVAAINAGGLEISGPVAAYKVKGRAALPEQVTGTYELILLCVKAQDTETATQQLLPHLAPDGCIVSVQNGLNEHLIARLTGVGRTVGCFVNFGADYQGPGHVQYGGRGAVVVGEIDGSHSERIVQIHRLFSQFETDAVLTDNIWGYLWSKMIYGALLFATALTNESIADGLADLRYRALLAALGQEVAAVAAAEGVKLQAFNGFDPAAFSPGSTTAALDRSFDDMVAFNRRSAKSHSGIWRDLVVRKRRTEVDAQLGPIVDIGRRHGIPVPLTARLIELIHDLEEGRRVQGLDVLDALGKT